jgi:signal transduction histidine kinase/ActR/RegA family two-component response regulator
LCTLLSHPPMPSAVPLDQWLAALDQAQVEESRQQLQEKIAQGELAYEREQQVLLDGEARWLLSRVRIEVSPAGALACARGATMDITARKQVDLLLRQTQGELRQQLGDLERLHLLSRRLMAGAGGPEPPLQALLDLVVELHGVRQGLLSLGTPGEQGGGPRRLQRRGAAPDRGPGARRRHLGDGRRHAPARGRGRRAGRRAHGRSARLGRADRLPGPLQPAAVLQRRHGHRRALGDAVIGVLSVMFPVARAPDAREIRLSDICAATASALAEGEWARQSAAENQLRFAVALESSAVAFTILAPVRDGSGRIADFRWTYANPAAARMLKRGLPDLLGALLSQVLPGAWAEPGPEPGLPARYAEVVERGQPCEFEVRSSLEGEDGWLHVIASPLDGAVAVWFADITARKRQQRALLDADRRKDEFLATLAHELRNPLAPIRQAALVARSAASSVVQKHWGLEVIDRQVQHMALLLEDLLDVSRITRGTLALRKSRVELATVVEAALESARPHLDARHHRLTLDLPCEPVLVDLDPMRIAQVLGNLLTNAAKYTDPGGRIVLSARRGSGELAISVADNGIGMRQEHLTQVFEMFSQVSSAVGRSAGGLGIGLALARGLIVLHGGHLEAQSAGLGLGSRFTVHLPLPAGVPAPVPDEPPAAVPPAAVSHAAGSRLLIADDNADAAQTLAEWFRLSGYEVLVAYDGEQAVAAFQRFRPQAALLDLGMPGLSGLEAVRLIRQAPAGGAAILIAITGWGRECDRHDALAAGFDHHITKPVDPAGVEALLVAAGVAVLRADGAVPLPG